MNDSRVKLVAILWKTYFNQQIIFSCILKYKPENYRDAPKFLIFLKASDVDKLLMIHNKHFYLSIFDVLRNYEQHVEPFNEKKYYFCGMESLAMECS